VTDAELQSLLSSHDARLRSQLAPWVDRASKLVASKVDDAAAHASKAITDTLRATPDGRATDRRASRSPSFQAAMNRLHELLESLAGPSPRSLAGMIRDAREEFYRESFPLWREQIESKYWSNPQGEPTQAGIARLRGMPTHDRVDVYLDLSKAIESAALDLRRAVNAGASTDSARGLAADRIGTWKRMKTGQLTRLASLELGDSYMLSWSQSGIDLVHADHQ